MNWILRIAPVIAASTWMSAQGPMPRLTPCPTTPRFVYSSRTDFDANLALSSSHALLRGDLDGRSGDDLVVVTGLIATVINTFLNDGSGRMHRVDTVVPISAATAGGALGDFDRDGDLDLAVVYERLGQSIFFLNDGLGGFMPEAREARLPGTMPVKSIAATDIDGDGWPDIVLGMYDGNQTRLFINDRRGGFRDVTATNMIIPVIGCVTHIVPSDIDDDGDMDLVVAIGGICGRMQENEVLVNDGQGHMTSILLQGRREWSLNAAVGDVNGDGRKDIVIGNQRGPAELWINMGGWFSDASGLLPVLSPGHYTYAIAVVDVNEDGLPDIVASTTTFPQGVQLRAYLNLGAAVLAERTRSWGAVAAAGLFAYDLTVADMDDDGDVDLIAGGNFYLRIYGPKILVNTHRHTLPVSAAAVGLPFEIDLWARPGQFLVPIVSGSLTALPLGSWGVLRVDPTSGVLLQPMMASECGKSRGRRG